MSENVCWICGNVHASGESCATSKDGRIGTTLEGKYAIKRVLGAGGMGKVYEGQHVHIGRRVAIKFLLPEYASHPEIMRRFENEARSAGSLEHENIAAVLDFGQTDDGARFLVMEYLDGQDCEKLLAKEGPLPVPRVINSVLQVCRGLDVAHREGIVHRDLKPANLFLVRRADRSELVKILDFGIAKLRKSEDQPGTATGLTLGTAYYMSPEQARGDKDVDHRTDVYALGVILYELLSGDKPHTGKSFLEIVNKILHTEPAPLEQLRPGLKSELVQVVRKAMSPDAAQRYQTVADLGEALIPFAGVPVTSFRSQGFAVESANPSDHTRPSTTGRESAKESASTTAPVTPRKLESETATRNGSKTKWIIGLAAVATVATGTVLWPRQPSRVESNASGASGASTAPTTIPASSRRVSQSEVLPTAVIAVSGQQDRPDGGVGLVASSVPRAAMGPPPAPAPVRKATGKSPIVVPTPAKPAPAPPVQTPVRRTVDISREPNF